MPELSLSIGLDSQSAPTTFPVSLYQKWANYPDSPMLISEYPYQLIVVSLGTTILWGSKTTNFYRGGTSILSGEPNSYAYSLVNGVWTFMFSKTAKYNLANCTPTTAEALRESNHNVLQSLNNYDAVIFAKTTP